MPKNTIEKIRLFVASPSDVAIERAKEVSMANPLLRDVYGSWGRA
ncbi:MAG: hypothetical protein ABIG63_19995 [Chloroflexota bacterium]